MATEFFGFIEQQSSYENNILSALKESQEKDIPLLLWGAGNVGNKAYEYLLNKEIQVSDVFVGDKQPNQIFHGKTVLSFDEACLKHKNFNIFVARILRDENNDSILSAKNVTGVYHLEPALFFEESDFDIAYFMKNKEAFVWTYENLADNLSKEGFIAFINARISKTYEHIKKFYCKDKYFCDDIFSYRDNEVYVDCGVFRSTTIQSFIDALHSNSITTYDYIYVFESDKEKFEDLLELSSRVEKLHNINKRAWSEKSILAYEPTAVSNSLYIKKEESIATDTVDNILNGNKATLIKTSMGGSSLEAIKGAKQTIIEHKPKLTATVYSKADEMITLPQYIKSLVPEYKIYFRFHTYSTLETVLYAVCK